MDKFDIDIFSKMFDAALASNNPAVKKALRNFMLVAAVVHAQEQEKNPELGLFGKLLYDISRLKHTVADLRNSNFSGNNTDPWLINKRSTTDAANRWYNRNNYTSNIINTSTSNLSSEIFLDDN